MRKPTIWVPARSDTNRPVESQKQARSLTFRIKKKKDSTIRAAKTKALISCAVTCAVTAQLICGFVFAYANCWFSRAVDLMIEGYTMAYLWSFVSQ